MRVLFVGNHSAFIYFPCLIKKLIKLYDKLNNFLNEKHELVLEDDFTQKDFIEHIEGKPFI